MSAPELSEYERGEVARFGIFAEEERVERVAEALYRAHRDPEEFWTVKWEHAYGMHDEYRRLAVAAIEALAPADETGAVDRVQSLIPPGTKDGVFSLKVCR
jgi:hypothetical protein